MSELLYLHLFLHLNVSSMQFLRDKETLGDQRTNIKVVLDYFSN